MKKTFKELNKFSQVFAGLVNKNKNFIDSKLGYACKRFEELNLTKIYKEYNNELLVVRIDYALTDKVTGALIKDETRGSRGFVYDKSGMKSVLKAEEAIDLAWQDKEFEVEPYICKPENIPSTLTEEETEVFTGLVI